MKKLNQMQKIRYSFVKLLTGSDLSKKRLPVMEAKSVKDGPVVWLTAGAHGDEVGGMVIVQEIFKIIRKKPLLKGEIHAFSLMNPIGFEAATEYIVLTQEDLNRSFPGDKTGSFAERIADKIFNTIIRTKPDLVLDLHNDWRDTIQYTLIDPLPAFKSKEIYEKVKSFGSKTGLVLIGEQKESIEKEMIDRSLTYSLLQKNIAALTMELGEDDVVNEDDVESGVNSIWNILQHLGMVEPMEKPFVHQAPESVRGRILKYSSKPVSSTSGIIRFLAKPGDIVKKGQPVARVYNAFGRLMETIDAPEKAIVLGLSDTAVSFPGLPVMSFGIID